MLKSREHKFGFWPLAPIERLVSTLADPARGEHAVVAVLFAYVAVWTLYAAVAKWGQAVHYDMAELVVWSREPALGYYKHPPLPAWLVGVWFKLFPLTDWAYYLLATVSAGLALWISWRLFEHYLDPDKRVMAFALLTLIPFYNFLALRFDYNAALVPLWAFATFCFIRSFEARTLALAALAGIAAASAMLGKYWSIFLLVGLALATLTDQRRGAYFSSVAPWVTVATGATLLLPHLGWLFVHDFAPLAYAVDSHAVSGSTAAESAVGYLAGGASYVALPVVLVLAASRPSRAAIRDILFPTVGNVPARRFAAITFWAALLLPAVVGPAAGLELNPIWTMSAFTVLPVVLLSSPLITIARTKVLTIVAIAVLLPFIMLAVAPLIALTTNRHASRSLPAKYGYELAQQMALEWRTMTNRPLRLVGGDLDLAYVSAFYLPDQPSAFAVSLSEAAPWVDNSRIRRDGIVLICYLHWDEAHCLHSAVRKVIDDIVTRAPVMRRIQIAIPGILRGVRGQYPGFIIYVVPPKD
jgi:4-amino-4-deoxy-L-arabinose transferase-like glycosyltransferase